MSGVFSSNEIARYRQEGYLFARSLFSEEEIQALGQRARADRSLDQASSSRDDGKGNAVRLSLWNHPGEGIYGMFARCRRVVDSVEQLLEGEAYHYHSKMILKDAKVGGAWAWHQDYGYWYQNGLLFPRLCSVMIAVDRATQENGCLQVLQGSHIMGRVDHILSGDQAGADMAVVSAAQETMPLIHAEMEPGDALFFHANTLHSSAPNHSDHSRWSLICCYNAASNNPYKNSHHPSYTKLHKVDDDEVLRVARQDFTESEVEFADLEHDDVSAKSLADAETAP
ncbi:MAG: phytanoyl-CoA dioxygenase family protein [Verrucomicrobiota bacterium]